MRSLLLPFLFCAGILPASMITNISYRFDASGNFAIAGSAGTLQELPNGVLLTGPFLSGAVTTELELGFDATPPDGMYIREALSQVTYRPTGTETLLDSTFVTPLGRSFRFGDGWNWPGSTNNGYPCSGVSGDAIIGCAVVNPAPPYSFPAASHLSVTLIAGNPFPSSAGSMTVDSVLLTFEADAIPPAVVDVVPEPWGLLPLGMLAIVWTSRRSSARRRSSRGNSSSSPS